MRVLPHHCQVTMFQICADVAAVILPGQYDYKMVDGDENTIFEPLNL